MSTTEIVPVTITTNSQGDAVLPVTGPVESVHAIAPPAPGGIIPPGVQFVPVPWFSGSAWCVRVYDFDGLPARCRTVTFQIVVTS